METSNFSKLKEVLADNSGAAELPELTVPQQVNPISASSYYELQDLKKNVLGDLGAYELSDLEFEPGKYELAVDYMGNLETAARTFGLDKLGIEETEAGYRLGEQEDSSLEALEGVESVVLNFASSVANDLNEKLMLPGVFYYGHNSDMGDSAIRLFFAFEDQNLMELKELGADLKSADLQAQASFSQILAVLEHEGCHEVAKKLHAILREH